MHDGDGVSPQAAVDLLVAYNALNDLSADFFATPLLGNGQTLTPGIYSINGATTLNLDLILDAENNANAVFIFLIEGHLLPAHTPPWC